MAFIKEIVRIKKQLEDLGNDAKIPHGSEPHLTDGTFVDNLEENYQFCVKNGIMTQCFNQVVENDAILVINKKRNNIEGYIGTSTLMEMAIAHHFKKKIFLLKKIPSYKKARWAHEVAIMRPIIINGDLSIVK